MSNQLDLFGALAPPLQLRRFTVEQYHRLGELGVLEPADNVELLEGWIVEKMNHRPIHGYLVRILNDFFMRELPLGWICQCQLPISTPRSEPEPDIAVIIGHHDDFRLQHPQGHDCRLVIEVADTSIDKDRAKAEIYRTAGVQEYWIVNVNEVLVERYRFRNSAMESHELFTADQTISLPLGDRTLELDLKFLK